MKACFLPTSILLPAQGVDLKKWAVIACDQYTSQPEYWQKVEEITKDAPSSYKLIYPEVYLGEEKNRTAEIHKHAEQYLSQGILTEQVHNGYILTERSVGGKVRVGLLGAIDLDQYEYMEEQSAPIRATEGTILSRIPPRVSIRAKSLVEIPHVMVLLEDVQHRLIEPLYARRNNLGKLYDFELMLNGGHMRGYKVEGNVAEGIFETFASIQEEKQNCLLAVGDGNHSVAAAKAYWSELSKTLTKEERQKHPARYALTEVVNLYSPAIVFEPIHRIVFGADIEKIQCMLEAEICVKGIEEVGKVTVFDKNSKKELLYNGINSSQCIKKVQHVLDRCAEEDKRIRIDYIHGEEHLKNLVQREEEAVGIILEPIQKEELFSIIRHGKVLPRKAFSMGESYEKRYYLECRKIVCEI